MPGPKVCPHSEAPLYYKPASNTPTQQCPNYCQYNHDYYETNYFNKKINKAKVHSYVAIAGVDRKVSNMHAAIMLIAD